MTQFLYHFVPPEMSGDILFPLNQLKTKYPKQYEVHQKKYEGREVLMETIIPVFNCLWNDVLHLSPLNPQVIVDYWREEGIEEPKEEISVFEVPLGHLDESKLLYFYPQLRVDRSSFYHTPEQFESFSIDTYHEHENITAIQKEIWKKDKAEGRRLFWFSHTTHILYHGRIETCGLNQFICR